MNENTNATQQNEGQGQVTETQIEKTYTEAEVNDMIQREADRRVSQALLKQEKKNNEKIAEAQKLAAMNEQEKYEYQLQQREKAIEEKEKALALMENKNEASKILAERGISLSLVDFVVAEDAETMKTNIDLLDRAFKASVQAEVQKRIGSGAPKAQSASVSSITTEQFRKMTTQELAQLNATQPELFAQLSAQLHNK